MQASESAGAGRARALRNATLIPGDDRERVYEEHPLILNKVCVATGPVQEAYDIVRQVLVHRDSGTCLTADSRSGKTTAISAVCNQLSLTDPGVPYGVAIAKGHDRSSERNFFTDLLTDLNHEAATSGTNAVRRQRVLNTIMSHAMLKKSSRYLLLVDEGQNWGEAEYTFLRDLTNDLKNKNVTVITVIFGHPALLSVRQKLVNRQRMDLVTRFLLTPRTFRGIKDQHEFLDVFRAHDDAGAMEYPPRSGISYSEFILPNAWKAGWRLEHEAEQAWDAFCLAARAFGMTPNNVGMNWVSGAIRNFFLSNAEGDASSKMPRMTDWPVSVDATGYAATFVH